MNRRAIVFGASGQLGVELVRELEARGDTVTACGRSQVDITDSAPVERVLTSSGAQVVFNAAAYNQMDAAEKEPLAALKVNALVENIVGREVDEAGIELAAGQGEVADAAGVPFPLRTFAFWLLPFSSSLILKSCRSTCR